MGSLTQIQKSVLIGCILGDGYLRIIKDRKNAILEMKRISKPGRRVYSPADKLPRVKNGLGVAIISTSHGLMTDKEARRSNFGGEVLCTIW